MYSSYLPNILINFIVKVAAKSLIKEAHFQDIQTQTMHQFYVTIIHFLEAHKA